jgi:hypothetical protein
MRWLKHLISLGLLLAAAAVALVTVLSNHSDDYGRVPLPQGGVVQLPKGKVTIFFRQPGDNSDPIQEVNTPFSFQVVSQGGTAVPVSSANGAPSANAVQRSETVGELGAVAKLDVPVSGIYTVSVAGADIAAGSASLEFGTNAGRALLNKWRLFAGMVIGAFLIALIPVPKPGRRWEDEIGPPTGWSSDPRAPYAG